MAWFSWAGSWTEPDGDSSEAFKLGEVVEYYSASQGSWIPAKVVAVNAKGTYDLDCKPGVPRQKIRSCAAARESRLSASGVLEFEPGEVVEYFSASQSDWILAKVLSINPNGTYNLDCKPDVPPERVRAQRDNDLVRSPLQKLQKPTRLRQASTIFNLCQVQALEPVQLLRVQRAGSRSQYEVCSEGAQALEAFGEKRIAVVSICGMRGTGKSYLMNALLDGMNNAPKFKVGSGSGDCTAGLWLWSYQDPEEEHAPVMAFLDCEGFGNDSDRDAQMMSLCALLSSVLVLNTKGTLHDSVFSSLALICRFAEHMEERGQEVSRPALLWVLRDFALELRDAAGHTMSSDEYLEQALHAADARGAGKEVRQNLLQFFNHRSCTTLVQPAGAENDPQKLQDIPYPSLCSEFRVGVEAMLAQLVAICHSHPKMVGGQSLGCASFAALLKHLVEAMNESKQLSVKGAWDAVQHTTCGGLADELRGIASQKLKLLKSGQALPDGTQLPMTDEALRAFFRNQRHELKDRWEEQAVGDEEVRKEYWQELKETLAREELQVRQQNGRLADQQLSQSLKLWQDWLDNSEGTIEEGEKISADLGKLLEHLPTTTVARAGRAAIEAAARRVAGARTAVVATVEQSAEAQRRALAWGEQAAKLEGNVRAELEATKAAIKKAADRWRQASQSKEAKTVELQGKVAEHEDGQQQLQSAQEELEEARARETELQVLNRSSQEKEQSLQQELEAARAMASKASAERLASQRCNEAAAEAAGRQNLQLQEELREAQVELQRAKEQLRAEREELKREWESHREKHQEKIQDLHVQLHAERKALTEAHDSNRTEHQQLLACVRQELEEERKQHSESKEGTRGQLLEHVRHIGTLEGKVAGLNTEADFLKGRIAELQDTLKESEAHMFKQSQGISSLRKDLDKAKTESGHARAEGEERVYKLRRDSTRKLQERSVLRRWIAECAELPEIELEDGKPRVSGRGCRVDADCPRSDTSFGACVCKQWWEGSDPPGYCELSVAQPWRPAFKRFWEESAAYCHHNWSQDRCAAELKMEEVLAEVRADAAAISSDPTEVKSCARELRQDQHPFESRMLPPPAWARWSFQTSAAISLKVFAVTSHVKFGNMRLPEATTAADLVLEGTWS
eukprot:s377_g13.t2